MLKKLFPSDTFVDVNDFKSIKDLAQYQISIAAFEEKCISFLRKKHIYNVNEPYSSWTKVLVYM